MTERLSLPLNTLLRSAGLLILLALSSSLAARASEANSGSIQSAPVQGIHLLDRYPTSMVEGDTLPEHARPWDFTGGDIFRLSRFSFKTGKDLRVETGVADVGIGHCKDGAVWAVVIPRETGELTSTVTGQPEKIASIWLRFHPAEIGNIFPPETVFADGATNLFLEIQRIANHKLRASWHAGDRVMIPRTNEMTVDVDTAGEMRRFFEVDEQAQTAKYVGFFRNKTVKPAPQITRDAAASAFDQLWSEYDRKYAMFVIKTNVDWTQLREEYRPKALASKSTLEFAGVCADMLAHLRDLHIWLTVAGDNVPVFYRPRTSNANRDAGQAILDGLNDEGEVAWAVTWDNIGYIVIYAWDDARIPEQCQQALEQMRNTRGLIVDVRSNGGGSEDQAMEFARRFVSDKYVYAYSQFRNGPAHTNLTKKLPREIDPGGPWRYDRPVIVLIGQKCMSSNESFIGMMTGDTNAITMGDHTCGSSGNPELIDLPLEMTVSVPQWIDYLPDGTVLDEHGFVPQVPFKPSAGAFDGDRDDLLKAALERLRQEPLPSRPISGPPFVSDEEAETNDNSRPKVVSVFPAQGAESVAPVINLRIRFDRPMDPMALKLDWLSGGFLDSDFPEYNPKTYEFTIPVRFPPGQVQEIEVNKHFQISLPRDGFQSADHRLARFFKWEFQTKAAAPVPSISHLPKVVKIFPAPGSTVPYRLFMDVQFDQPMESPDETLPHLVKTFELTNPSLISRIRYDARTHTFHLALLLYPNNKSTINLAGFYNEAGMQASPVTIEYQVSANALSDDDQKRFRTAERNSRLLRTLELMKRRRAEMTSVSERVQTLFMFGNDGGVLNRLTSQNASFEWQQPEQFYVDGADMMMMSTAFAIGSDGKQWWFLDGDSTGTNLQVCPFDRNRQLNLSLCDPFNLMLKTPAQAAAARDLGYVGEATFDDVKCRLLEGWGWDKVAPPTMTPVGFLTQWWVDNRTGRLLANEVFADGSVEKTKFLYDDVNQPLPARDFAVPKINGLSPSPAGPLGKEFTKRFVEVMDGSDGNMQIHYGKTGPKKSESGGFGNFE